MSYNDLAATSAAVYADSMRGLHLNEAEAAAHEFVQSDAQRLYKFSPWLFQYLREHDVATLVISGAPDIVLNEYSRRYSLDGTCGLQLRRDKADRFDGMVEKNPGVLEVKEATIDTWCRGASIAAAFGNTVADLPLLTRACLGVVINGLVSDFSPDIRQKLVFCAPEDVEEVVRLNYPPNRRI
jgi:phosphoserine phosphatase